MIISRLLFAMVLLHLSVSFQALAQDAIKWMNIEEAEQACAQKPKKIFIKVYTKWCGWCKKMDASTFKDPEVIAYLNENFYAVSLDAESADNIIFRNKVFKYDAQRQANELAILFLNGQMSYPTSVFLDEKLTVIQSVGGYQDAGQFNFIQHYFGSNFYKKKKSLEDYKSVYFKRSE